MLGLTIFILLAILLFWGMVLPWLIGSWVYLRRNQSRWGDTPPPYTPSVALIVPCKGLDQGFTQNMEAILSQDYPDYRVIFVTATEDDPAYPALRQLIGSNPRERLITAGLPTRSSQKVNNLLRGVEEAKDVEVLAFVDSDARPYPQWLSHLVAPLRDPEVAATSGYPWHVPERGGVWSWARAYLNNLIALHLAVGWNLGLWGGATALRRHTFAEAGLKEAWETALADDAVMSHRLRRLGRRIVFVPQCLTTMVEDISFWDFFHLLVRQMVIVKVYDPLLWGLGGAIVFILLGIQLGGLVVTPLGLFYPELLPLGLLLVIQIPLQILVGALVPAFLFRDRRTSLWAPLIFLIEALLMIAFLRSLLTNRITWRGVTYALISPTETQVISH